MSILGIKHPGPLSNKLERMLSLLPTPLHFVSMPFLLCLSYCCSYF
uniref:Uncharacterized protein n=1 Tax=Picea glauca TaxID=3330 RepID=A0A101LYS9_PICGL|nr:hypothetical protein ABT39_MTgene4840 [Picea glauca]QHR88777.1 hypothetical protein Q903MT_gene2792 [Picea sitchensis]